MTRIATVYPVLNQFKLCLEAIDSIVTKHEHFEVILNQWENPVPLSAAWNRGIAEAERRGAEYILVSNDDVIYSPWTYDNLIATFENSSEDVIMVTGVNNRGGCPDPKMMKYWPEPENVTTAEHPDFALFCVRRGFLDQIGPFDIHFRPAYFEDNDMHYRIKLLGYRAIATTAAPYYHYGSQTQNDGLAEGRPVVDGTKFEANRAYYCSKWGGSPSSERFLTPFDNPEYNPKDWQLEWRQDG